MTNPRGFISNEAARHIAEKHTIEPEHSIILGLLDQLAAPAAVPPKSTLTGKSLKAEWKRTHPDKDPPGFK